MAGQTALVVSAHAADFVWRAGGAIALHAAKGYAVTIVCLSFGERGESAKLWKEPGATLQAVKDARRKESEVPIVEVICTLVASELIQDGEVRRVGENKTIKVDIRVIQVLLGHTKLDTTAHYSRVDSSTLKAVRSPLERLRRSDLPPA